MAIKTDDSSISINFVYHNDELDEDFSIKFHHVDGIGQAVSISGQTRLTSDLGVDYLSFPVQLLVETIDFLRSQGYLRLAGMASVVPSSTGGTQISRGSSAGILPMPDLSGGNSSSLPKPVVEKTAAEAGPPLQSLLSVPMSNESAMINGNGEIVVDDTLDGDADVEMADDVLESEYDEIVKERKEAFKRAENIENRVSRAKRVDYGERIKKKLEQQHEAEYEEYEEC